MELGLRIKELRKENKLSQEELSQIIGVTTGAVSKWESGLASPDLGNLVLLAKVFNVSVDYLLDYEMDSNTLESTYLRLVKLTNNREFLLSLNDVKNIASRYSNSVDINYMLGSYLIAKSYSKNDKDELAYALECSLRSFNLYYSDRNTEISRGDIIEQILLLYQRLERPKDAIDFINDNRLDGNALTLGAAYEMLNDNKNALTYLSKNMIAAISMIINGAIYEIKIFHKMNDDVKAVKLCDWVIDILEPLILKKGVSFEAVIAIFNICKVCFLYKDNKHHEALEKAIDIAIAYKLDYHINNENTAFFYGEDTSLTSFSDDLIVEFKNVIEELVVNEKENIIKELEEQYEKRKKIYK